VLGIRAEHLEMGMPTGVDAVLPAEKPEAVIADFSGSSEIGMTGEIVRTANPLELSD
jgi:hypothetical protein